MSLVLDCSIALAWHFEDESTPATDAVLMRATGGGALVPALWHLEMANALRSAIRRGRITEAHRDAALADLRRLEIVVDDETAMRAWSATLALSDRLGLTPYDAAYIELAQRRRLPLASLNGPMRAAAAALGLEVLGQET